MITETMNKKEVKKHFAKDYWEGFYKFIDHKKEEWLKYRKKLYPKQLGWKTFKYTNKHSNQSYLLTFMKARRMEDVKKNMVICAPVQSSRPLYYFINVNTDDFCVCSSHFFNRYAERTGIPSVYPSIIGKFLVENPYQQAIYVGKNEHGLPDRVVYATMQGIIIAEIDQKRGIYIWRTFVSLDMLKQTQRNAYSKVVDLLSGLGYIYTEAMNGEYMDKMTILIGELTREISLEASDIYAKYWEDDNQ